MWYLICFWHPMYSACEISGSQNQGKKQNTFSNICFYIKVEYFGMAMFLRSF